jgi:hypothetical protein
MDSVILEHSLVLGLILVSFLKVKSMLPLKKKYATPLKKRSMLPSTPIIENTEACNGGVSYCIT